MSDEQGIPQHVGDFLKGLGEKGWDFTLGRKRPMFRSDPYRRNTFRTVWEPTFGRVNYDKILPDVGNFLWSAGSYALYSAPFAYFGIDRKTWEFLPVPPLVKVVTDPKRFMLWTIGTAAGGAIGGIPGAYVGGQIGYYLDERDEPLFRSSTSRGGSPGGVSMIVDQLFPDTPRFRSKKSLWGTRGSEGTIQSVARRVGDFLSDRPDYAGKARGYNRDPLDQPLAEPTRGEQFLQDRDNRGPDPYNEAWRDRP